MSLYKGWLSACDAVLLMLIAVQFETTVFPTSRHFKIGNFLESVAFYFRVSQLCLSSLFHLFLNMEDPENTAEGPTRRLESIKNHLNPHSSTSSSDQAYEKSEWKVGSCPCKKPSLKALIDDRHV
jgi:hypothetical protein